MYFKKSIKKDEVQCNLWVKFYPCMFVKLVIAKNIDPAIMNSSCTKLVQ